MRKELRGRLPAGGFANVSPTRSRTMRAVRSTNNRSTERRLRMALVRAGMKGWSVRPVGVFGNPDFVFPERRLTIFVDGCFWHGCPTCSHAPIRTRPAYWEAKIKFNRQKDRRIASRLRRMGWKVLRIWEHQLKHDPSLALGLIAEKIASRTPHAVQFRASGGCQRSRMR